MKKYSVQLISDAEQDLLDIYRYVANNDSITKAEQLLSKLEDLCSDLEFFPQRGHTPFEFQRLAINTYLEVHYKVYRVIYQTRNANVFVHCILDSRRDLADLLMQRLLLNDQ